MRGSIALALLAAVLTAGCEAKVDLKSALQVVDVSTGWHDAGVTSGQNKVVPSVSFKFKNVSDQSLSILQANVVFRRAGEEWGASYVKVVGSDGLAPGAASATQNVNCPKGYTGTESRQHMLDNPQFVDARVQIFAKYGSAQWEPVGEYTVDRRLIAK